jgi:uncharacterized protein
MAKAKRLAENNAITLNSHITTNGYLLTPELASSLVEVGVNSFQITLDGRREDHDIKRLLHSQLISKGIAPTQHKSSRDQEQGTYDQIIANIRSLLDIRRVFHVLIRTNYDWDSFTRVPEFMDEIKRDIGDDPRVRFDFCPIWTDEGDQAVSVPLGLDRQRTLADLLDKASSRGLRTDLGASFRPGGLVCYAAKRNSFVVRSDGSLNKCTVALDKDYNHIGQLRPDGLLSIDKGKLDKWVLSGIDSDSTCQKCSLAPACQGNVCPLERFENGRRPCPSAKTIPDKTIPLAVDNI